MPSANSFNAFRTLKIKNQTYGFFDLRALEAHGLSATQLPYSLKILLENLLRFEDEDTVKRKDIEALCNWLKERTSNHEIAYRPARVLMQDFTGVPAIADLAAMRDAIKKMGGDPKRINPLSPVDLVIDHSIQVDAYGDPLALQKNAKKEMQRNVERYRFLKWGQNSFDNFKVVPPSTGICHQVNLEYLAKTVRLIECEGQVLAIPDTVVGTDSHTTMINCLGVLGWGVGGIEAEAAMLGQPISMLIPEVVGVKLTGRLEEGVTATDLVLQLTEMLRRQNVVGKFVEYYGPGLKTLPTSDRATISNMAPEYGATCGFFPIDELTLAYLNLTGRSETEIELVKQYAQQQGLWHNEAHEPCYTHQLALDLATVQPALAGPKRPQDRLALDKLQTSLKNLLPQKSDGNQNQSQKLQHGDVVIAAITSCTNTSNPNVLLAAGLLAKKAVEKGLLCKSWVKTSLAPGSKVVARYLEATGLQPYLDKLGFNIVGYGCMTCIGNSGPLPEATTQAIQEDDLVVSAVLSGNRNFEGRIHPLVKANWLASPPLVVAFALAGTVDIDLKTQPLSLNEQGEAVYLRDVWPSNLEIQHEMAKISREMYQAQYKNVFQGEADWQAIQVPSGETYEWQSTSTYIQKPPFFDGMSFEPKEISNIDNARILAILGDSITTDHISPAGSIKTESPAGSYLKQHGIDSADFNSYGARRGNHEIMMRGTFANIRIRNEILNNVEGGQTKHFPTGAMMSIYDAAMQYQKENIALIVVAGKEYGTGSSRDWAAKGPKLLGVRAVIAESFERIHRSNLIGMGILPLQFLEDVNRKILNLVGDEIITIKLNDTMQPKQILAATCKRSDGVVFKVDLLCRIDTLTELAYYRHGGILQYVLRNLLQHDAKQTTKKFA